MNTDLTSDIRLAYPWALALLVLLPLAWVYARRRVGSNGVLRLSTTAALQSLPYSGKAHLARLLPWARYIAAALLIVALARPQRTQVSEVIDSEGIDLVLSLDVSGSMLAEDFSPNRMEAAKKMAGEFVAGRTGDRIGLVTFGEASLSQCPLTQDHRALTQILNGVRSGSLGQATAIGLGIASAVDRLRQSPGKSKVVILMTDGVNNAGAIDPLTALEVAKAFGVRIYTIGVGSNGMAPSPAPMPDGSTALVMQPVEIDEALLQKIATETGGVYYRATGNDALRAIYASIDKLEKSKAEMTTYREHTELFYPLALVALGLLFLELLLGATVLRGIA